jgi:hypothetical protein
MKHQGQKIALNKAPNSRHKIENKYWKKESASPILPILG